MMRWIEAAAEESYSHRAFSPIAPVLLRKMEDEPHAHLFDRVIVTVRTERIKTAVAKLSHPPVHDWKQLDIQPGQSLIFKVVVENDLAARCSVGQAIVTSAKSDRPLDVWLERGELPGQAVESAAERG